MSFGCIYIDGDVFGGCEELVNKNIYKVWI